MSQASRSHGTTDGMGHISHGTKVPCARRSHKTKDVTDQQKPGGRI